MKESRKRQKEVERERERERERIITNTETREVTVGSRKQIEGNCKLK